MTEYNKGLTKVYNRFHDPDERSNEIGELRRLHDAMDRSVLDAYGWTDIHPTCEFELDGRMTRPRTAGGARSRGATAGPSRCATKCWAALNAQRAEEECLALGDL